MKINRQLIIGFTSVILLGLAIGGVLISKQNKLLQIQNELQSQQLKQQTELTESIRKSSLIPMMVSLLTKVEKELKESNKLKDSTIESLAELSHSFEPEPYVYVKNETLSYRKPSKERGMLLLALVKLEMDSSSFEKVKNKVSFEGADLIKANLSGVNLDRANLRCADLMEADLNEVSLVQSDLRSTNFWAAKLNRANLTEAKLNRANLSWAEINESDLKKADLRQVNLQSAKLRKADLKGVDLTVSDLRNAIFLEANLADVDFKDTDLRQANFSKANLRQADLKRTNMTETNLLEANLTDTKLTEVGVLTKNWLQNLSGWKVIGAIEIQKQYQIADKVFGEANFELELVK